MGQAKRKKMAKEAQDKQEQPAAADNLPFDPEGFPATASEPPAEEIEKCGLPMVDIANGPKYLAGEIIGFCENPKPCVLHANRLVYAVGEPPHVVLADDDDEKAGGCGVYTWAAPEHLSEIVLSDEESFSFYDFADKCDLGIPCAFHGMLGAPPAPPSRPPLLSEPRSFPIATINLDQACNIREQISESAIRARMEALSRGAIQKPAVLWPQSRADELIWPGKRFTRDLDAQWVLLGGNITTIARHRRGETEIQACEFLGDAKEAQIYIGTDNIGGIPMSSFELARYYDSLIGEGENQYDGVTDLHRNLKEHGAVVSRSQIQNLVKAYRQLEPDLRAAWAKRSVLLGDESDESMAIEGRLATDEFIFWVSSLSKPEQLGVWETVKRGTSWKELKNGPKPEKPAVQERKFLGAPLRASLSPQDAEMRFDQAARLAPQLKPVFTIFAKFLLTEFTAQDFADAMYKLNAPARKAPASTKKPTPKKVAKKKGGRRIKA